MRLKQKLARKHWSIKAGRTLNRHKFTEEQIYSIREALEESYVAGFDHMKGLAVDYIDRHLENSSTPKDEHMRDMFSLGENLVKEDPNGWS